MDGPTYVPDTWVERVVGNRTWLGPMRKTITVNTNERTITIVYPTGYIYAHN